MVREYVSILWNLELSVCSMQDWGRWLSSCKAVWCRLYDNLFLCYPFSAYFLSVILHISGVSCLMLLSRAELLKVINFLRLLKFVFDEESWRLFSASCTILGRYKFQYLFETLISPWIFCDCCLICFFVGFSLLGLGWFVCLCCLGLRLCYCVKVLSGSNYNILCD